MSIRLQPPAQWEATLLAWAHKALEQHRPGETDQEPLRIGALDAAYAHCDAITRANSKTFYAASSLLPEAKRQAARALYAFCRVTDDLVDRAGVDATKQDVCQQLITWRAASLAPSAEPGVSPVVVAWTNARARFDIPCGYAEQLIDGVARDLEKSRYATFDELAAYAYGVASTVGLMAMHIIGYEGAEAIPYAVKLGVALQVTNILRDVGEDYRIGRIYLPADEMSAFGVSEDDIAAERVSDNWRAFMRFQIARVRDLYDEAMPGIGLLAREGRFAITAAADLYRAILTDIEAHDYNVFNRRAHISKWGKLVRLPRIYLRSRSLHVD